MSSLIQLKRTATPGNVPITGNLSYGEVALNITDGKLFFKKTIGGVDSIVTLQQLNAGTGVTFDANGNINVGQNIATTSTPTFAGITISPIGYPNSLSVNSIGNVSVANTLNLFGNVNVTNNISLLGSVTDSVNSTGTNGQVLTATSSGVAWQTSAATSATASLLKTFNILGDFGLLIGTARYIPIQQDTIRTVVMQVSKVVQQDLMVGLYRNSSFLQFFTIPSGQNYAKYNGLTYIIQANESYTVNVVAGSASNLSMAFYNINI